MAKRVLLPGYVENWNLIQRPFSSLCLAVYCTFSTQQTSQKYFDILENIQECLLKAVTIEVCTGGKEIYQN